MNKQEKILQTAKELFLQYGYKKTTLDDIADRLGIQKGGVYYYYKGKQDLFRAVLKLELDEYKVRIVNAIQDKNGLRERLTAYYIGKMDFIAERKSKEFNVMQEFLVTDELGGSFRFLNEELKDMLMWEKVFIREQLVNPLIQDTTDEAVLEFMTDYIHQDTSGLVYRMTMMGDFEKFRKIVLFHLDLMITGIEHKRFHEGDSK